MNKILVFGLMCCALSSCTPLDHIKKLHLGSHIENIISVDPKHQRAKGRDKVETQYPYACQSCRVEESEIINTPQYIEQHTIPSYAYDSYVPHPLHPERYIHSEIRERMPSQYMNRIPSGRKSSLPTIYQSRK